MKENQNNAGVVKNKVSTPAQKTKSKTIEVKCVMNAKAMNWAVGLAAGLSIGVAAVVAWKLIRDRKRK